MRRGRHTYINVDVNVNVVLVVYCVDIKTTKLSHQHLQWMDMVCVPLGGLMLANVTHIPQVYSTYTGTIIQLHECQGKSLLTCVCA